jgi:hypothetical protein
MYTLPLTTLSYGQRVRGIWQLFLWLVLHAGHVNQVDSILEPHGFNVLSRYRWQRGLIYSMHRTFPRTGTFGGS